MAGEVAGRLETIEAELADIGSRLERLYEALETSALTLTYTIPMPVDGMTSEGVPVLDFVQSGLPLLFLTCALVRFTRKRFWHLPNLRKP